MEYRLWKAVVEVIDSVYSRTPVRFEFSHADIVKCYYWAVISDRPVRWCCQKENWPLAFRKRQLPSESTMSRRLRSPAVIALLNAVEQRVVAPKQTELYWRIDGKPLVIGGCSKDRQAGYGRAAGCMAKGYKIHAIYGRSGSLAGWRLAPMNVDERKMAVRLVKNAPDEVMGYLAGDGNYDSNKLHTACDDRGNLQLVTPRRYGPGKGTGHRKQTSGRRRAIALLENPFPKFGDQLLKDRSAIEREFGNLTNWGGGLTCLPAWVRTYRRVRRWVQAKLVLRGLKTMTETTTCAA
jgi:hypothetical protein